MARYPLEDVSSISDVRRLIRAELKLVNADPAQSFDCLVAITETCTNALLHGLGPEGSEVPFVAWEISRERASFHVEDYSAQLWSRRQHPSGRSVEHRENGYGLELIDGLMDEVEITADETGTVVTLTKFLSP